MPRPKHPGRIHPKPIRHFECDHHSPGNRRQSHSHRSLGRKLERGNGTFIEHHQPRNGVNGMEEIVELKNISAAYEGTTVLHDVNFTIRDKDFVGIIGPNGGGKTTLLKVILGLLKPTAGEVVYHGAKQALFGYLPQNSRFDARFPISTREVVLSGLLSEKGIFRRYTRQDKAKADELLATYGMGDFRERPIGELSGGQMQRVFLCLSSRSLKPLYRFGMKVSSKNL